MAKQLRKSAKKKTQLVLNFVILLTHETKYTYFTS